MIYTKLFKHLIFQVTCFIEWQKLQNSNNYISLCVFKLKSTHIKKELSIYFSSYIIQHLCICLCSISRRLRQLSSKQQVVLYLQIGYGRRLGADSEGSSFSFSTSLLTTRLYWAMLDPAALYCPYTVFLNACVWKWVNATKIKWLVGYIPGIYLHRHFKKGCPGFNNA